METRLQKREGKLDGIVETMNTIAVQGERLKQIEKDNAVLWRKWDDSMVPHMAQCPKKQVKWLWCIVLPMGIALLGVAVALGAG